MAVRTTGIDGKPNGMFAIGLPIESRWEAGAARTWLQAAVFRLLEVPVVVCRKRATLGRYLNAVVFPQHCQLSMH